jgi:adenylate cyclase class 2
VLTWKGPNQPGKYKSRPEIETWVGSLDAVHKILGNLGFEPVFRYEKYRREFTHQENSSGVVTCDETPIGDFLELEGSGEWIDETASRLGFSAKDYVLDSYGRLYQGYCQQNRIDVQNMVFTS